MVKKVCKETPDIHAYAAFPGIKHCQTKMLLGEYCSIDINITQAMFDEAKRRIHKLAYVGLTDAFNASVCLFHHTFGGTPEEYMFTTHTRNGKHLQKRKKLQCGIGERVPSSMWKELPVDIEPLDMELYVARVVGSSALVAVCTLRPRGTTAMRAPHACTCALGAQRQCVRPMHALALQSTQVECVQQTD